MLCLIGLWASPCWIVTHDHSRYLRLIELFGKAFSNGFLYPRWMAELYGGYGYPTFVFYQPAFFFISLPFNLAFSSPFLAIKFSTVLLLFTGTCGIYRTARLFLSDSWLAVAVAAFYLLTPYIYVNIFVRGDFSELCAMMVIPWITFHFLSLTNARQRAPDSTPITLGLALTIAGLIYSHLLITIIFFPFLFLLTLIFLLFYIPSGKKLSFFFNMILAILLALALSSPYWYFCISLHNNIQFSRAVTGYFSSTRHLIYLYQYFSNFWGFGGSVAGPHDGMSFQLGAMHFLTAGLGCLLGRKDRRIVLFFATYILLLLIMGPLWPLWLKIYPPASIIQFPWRGLTITATFQIICTLGCFLWLQKQTPRLKWLTVTGWLLLAVIIHFHQFTGQYNGSHYQYNKTTADPVKAGFSTSILGEFLPTTAARNIPPRNNDPILRSYQGATLIPLPESNDHNIHYKIISPGPDVILIEQLYFPGWKVILNGEPLSPNLLEKSIDPQGRILLRINAAGEHDLRAFYAGPPNKQAVFFWALTASALIVLLILKINGVSFTYSTIPACWSALFRKGP